MQTVSSHAPSPVGEPSDEMRGDRCGNELERAGEHEHPHVEAVAQPQRRAGKAQQGRPDPPAGRARRPEPLVRTLETFFAGGGTSPRPRGDCTCRSAVRYPLGRVHALTGSGVHDTHDRFTLNAAVVGARLIDWPNEQEPPALTGHERGAPVYAGSGAPVTATGQSAPWITAILTDPAIMP